MDRRDFFRKLLHKAGESVVAHVEQKIEQRINWVRPPYAVPELDFLLACSRCGECIKACPEQVIFPLPAKLGLQLINTPAMDLTYKACLLCANWPCVAVCEKQALCKPEQDRHGQPTWPTLAKAVVDTDRCIAHLGIDCGACQDRCPLPNTLLWQHNKPVINTDACVGCGQCRQACIHDPKAIHIHLLTRPEAHPEV